MPELPEVRALAQFVAEHAAGRSVARVDVAAFSALKTFDPPISALVGREVTGAGNRGKFTVVGLGGLNLVFHLARGGWLHWSDALPSTPVKAGRGPLALRVHLDDGSGWDLTEAGTQKRLAVYVVADPAAVPGIARLGPDALDPGLDAAALGALIKDKRAQIKRVITDQSVIAGIGNAYGDEILHTARLSPFKLASTLTPEQVEDLHAAMRSVLEDAVRRCVGQGVALLKAEKRSGLRVHGRTGEACPVCGDTVHEISFADTSWQYCPTCQTGGKPLADRRMSKLGVRR
jgi:formamidopyrimidine-DNA glycosylase